VKTILDLLESKGLPKVPQVWDYKLISPTTMDDVPELYLYIIDVVKGKPSTKRSYKIIIQDLDLEELPVWTDGVEPSDPFRG